MRKLNLVSRLVHNDYGMTTNYLNPTLEGHNHIAAPPVGTELLVSSSSDTGPYWNPQSIAQTLLSPESEAVSIL